jgi:endoglucanase
VPTLPDLANILPPAEHLAVRGTQIVDGDGRAVTLVGATDYSLEFTCAGDGHFHLADFQAMRSWGMNTVRITLSSTFWRNFDGSCPDYPGTVAAAVANAESAGLFVILTLQWDAPFSLPQDATTGGAQCPLPDAKYDVAFWQDLAEIYQDDPRVIFDLFSEPYNVDWTEWETGGLMTTNCSLYSIPRTYEAIGMPQLAAKVRTIAPTNFIILSGAGWGYDLSGIEAAGSVALPNVLYGTHPFDHTGGSQQPFDWPRAFGTTAASLPVIATEFGSYDCGTSYIAQAITYFERLHISFVAWAWTTGSCAVPSLLSSWSGTPSSPYGVYIQQQMLALAKG